MVNRRLGDTGDSEGEDVWLTFGIYDLKTKINISRSRKKCEKIKVLNNLFGKLTSKLYKLTNNVCTAEYDLSAKCKNTNDGMN